MDIKVVILQDKVFEIGESPIYSAEHDVIGKVSYKLAISNKFKILKDHEEVYSGVSKLLTFMPKMFIYDKHENQVGLIKRKLSWFSKKYHYIQHDGTTYEIAGNILDRKFNVMRTDGTPVIRVNTTSSYFSLRPHTFALEFIELDIDIWEAIAVIQGVRMMVKDENNNSHSAPAQ
ncbi:hypothetical protein CN918_25860 [Priestia megaterium]|nr:hypothetical protein CN918_25860 [Priestia megaterium]